MNKQNLKVNENNDLLLKKNKVVSEFFPKVKNAILNEPFVLNVYCCFVVQIYDIIFN